MKKQKKKNGQALVEFVIILPIFIIMLLSAVDIGKILYTKNALEGKMEDVITLYEENKTYEEIQTYLEKDNKNTTIEFKNENNEYLKFKLIKEVEITTPGLNIIFQNPYKVSVERVLYYDS